MPERFRFGFHKPQNLVGEPPARIQSRQRNIELLEAAAEADGQEAAEGPEQSAPFGPGIELVGGSLLIKTGHLRVNGLGLEGLSPEASKIRHNPLRTVRPIESQAFLSRQIFEITAPDSGRRSGRTGQPLIGAQVDSSAGTLHPPLGDPVGQVTALGAEPDHR